jgi:hypothetical protein
MTSLRLIARPALQRASSQPHPESATLAEERREVFESVLMSLAQNPVDADQLAAGSHLLRHLSRTAAH